MSDPAPELTPDDEAALDLLHKLFVPPDDALGSFMFDLNKDAFKPIPFNDRRVTEGTLDANNTVNSNG